MTSLVTTHNHRTTFAEALSKAGEVSDGYRDPSGKFGINLEKVLSEIQSELSTCLVGLTSYEEAGKVGANATLRCLHELFSEVFPSLHSNDGSMEDACNVIAGLCLHNLPSPVTCVEMAWMQQKASTTRHALLNLLRVAQVDSETEEVHSSHSMKAAILDVLKETLQITPGTGEAEISSIGALLVGPDDQNSTRLALDAFYELGKIGGNTNSNILDNWSLASVYGSPANLLSRFERRFHELQPHIEQQICQAVGEAVKTVIIASLPEDSTAQQVAQRIRAHNPRFLAFLKPSLDELLSSEHRKVLVNAACDAVAQGFCHERLAYVMNKWSNISSNQTSSSKFVQHLVGLSD